jgi:hypothetical protein
MSGVSWPRIRVTALEDLLGGTPLDELVGVREEVALDGRRRDLERAEEEGILADAQYISGARESLGLDGMGQLGQRGALAKENRVLAHLATFKAPQHGEGVGSLGHLVLARFEASGASVHQRQQREAEGL